MFMTIVIIIQAVSTWSLDNNNKAKRDLVCSQMISISNVLYMFQMDNGTFPDTEEGLKALVTNPDANKYPAYYSKSYFKRVPKDSWGQPIQYIKNGNSFELVSFGADRKEGGIDNAEDIYYSKCQK